MVTVKERGILFSKPMVQGLLDNRKGMTRRVIKQPPPENLEELLKNADAVIDGMGLADQVTRFLDIKCPYGVVGDHLWVKETFSDANSDDGTCICYKADSERIYVDADNFPEKYLFANWAADLESGTEGHWRPSIFMPRIASRILLEITNIKVEQLNDISEADALAEGITYDQLPVNNQDQTKAKTWFRGLWESINGTGSWAENPWVWVVEFRVLEIKK